MSGSFTCKLDEEGLAFFNATCAKKFSEQAVAFLNAYWEEVHDQAEFVFGCAWEVFKKCDMDAKGCEYLHLYEEGNDLDFNIGLKVYESMVKHVGDGTDLTKGDGGLRNVYAEFVDGGKDNIYAKSLPEMMTSIVRKKELKEKVDVNFDGRVGFLEYLLYQYKDVANPADFVSRSLKAPDEDPAVKKARLALEDVNARIKAFELEKARLEGLAEKPGVKGLAAKNQLAQLSSSPLMEELNRALITAEAALRKASKAAKSGGGGDGAKSSALPSQGAIWWMEKDLESKKKKYGKK